VQDVVGFLELWWGHSGQEVRGNVPTSKATKWRPVKLTEVDDVIADCFWEYRQHGRKVVSRVAIAHPHPDPSGQDWYCPVLIEGWTDGWRPVYGVFGLDALINASRYLHAFFHEVHLTDVRETRRKRSRRVGRSPGRPKPRKR